MVDVVVNEGALCVGDRLFDRMQLLSEVQTRAPGFDHLDDAAEVAFRTSQPLHDIWVCGMERLICHTYILSWGRGYVKRQKYSTATKKAFTRTRATTIPTP